MCAAALLLWASGLAMQRWLLLESVDRRTALIAALAYMAAPYHLLIDHYIRGAFAESTAYVLLPLVMLAIQRTVAGRPAAPILLAASYAALLMSHLPTALLVSVTLVPASIAFRVRALSQLLRVAAGVGAGGRNDPGRFRRTQPEP